MNITDFELNVLYNQYQGLPTISQYLGPTAQTGVGNALPNVIANLKLMNQEVPVPAPSIVFPTIPGSNVQSSTYPHLRYYFKIPLNDLLKTLTTYSNTLVLNNVIPSYTDSTGGYTVNIFIDDTALNSTTYPYNFDSVTGILTFFKATDDASPPIPYGSVITMSYWRYVGTFGSGSSNFSNVTTSATNFDYPIIFANVGLTSNLFNDASLTYNPSTNALTVTNGSFVGAGTGLTGNGVSFRSGSSNFSNVTTSATNFDYRIVFANVGLTSNLFNDASLTYNPSTNALTVTNGSFVGAGTGLTGNGVSFRSGSSNFSNVTTSATNFDYRIIFANVGLTSNLFNDASLTYNPSTNALTITYGTVTATSFSGAGTGLLGTGSFFTAGTANAVLVSIPAVPTNSAHSIVFALSGGSASLIGDGGLTYNPSTQALLFTNGMFTGTNSGIYFTGNISQGTEIGLASAGLSTLNNIIGIDDYNNIQLGHSGSEYNSWFIGAQFKGGSQTTILSLAPYGIAQVDCWYVDGYGNTNQAGSITAGVFVGEGTGLTGTGVSFRSGSSNFSNVTESATNFDYRIIFANVGLTSNLFNDASLTYNPSTNALTITNGSFVGSLNGSATLIDTTETATNATHYITFVSSLASNTAGQNLRNDASLTYNPLSNALTITNGSFVGAGTGLTGNGVSFRSGSSNFSNVTESATNFDYPIIFANVGLTSNLFSNTNLTYNPFKGQLNIGNQPGYVIDSSNTVPLALLDNSLPLYGGFINIQLGASNDISWFIGAQDTFSAPATILSIAPVGTDQTSHFYITALGTTSSPIVEARTYFTGPGTGLTGTGASFRSGSSNFSNVTTSAATSFDYRIVFANVGPTSNLFNDASLTYNPLSNALIITNGTILANVITATLNISCPSITAITTFTGPGTGLTGTGVSFRSGSSNFSNVTESATNFDYPIIFANVGLTSNLFNDASLTYNPLSNALTITNGSFVGSLNGSATLIDTTETATNATHYITFVSSLASNTAGQNLRNDASLTYNPLSNALTITNGSFVGSLNGSATLIDTTETATNATHYITFVSSLASNTAGQNLRNDASITYNPSSNALVVTNGTITATSFSSTSDRNSKKDITKLTQEESENLIKILKPVKYTFKNDDKIRFGFIAQDIFSTFDGENFGLATETTVSYQELISPLVKIVANLLKRVEKLESKLAIPLSEN